MKYDMCIKNKQEKKFHTSKNLLRLKRICNIHVCEIIKEKKLITLKIKFFSNFYF